MKSKINKFYRNKPARFFEALSFLVTFLSISAQVAFIYWRLFPQIRLQPIVPLHYNIHSGVDLVGPWWHIFTLPFIGFVVFLINFTAGRIAERKDMSVSIFYACVTILIQLFLMLALIFVIAVNISYYG